MAVIIGHAGESARKTWFINLFSAPVAVFIMAVLVTPVFIFVFSRGNPACVALEIVVLTAVCLYIWRDDYLEMAAEMRGASNWAKGADGEARAGRALADLPDSYVVFHDFKPVIRGVVVDWNVDHIVIGPNGMFVIETKNYSKSRVLPAAKSSLTRRNTLQARRNSLMFKDKLKAWSAGSLGDVFVVPILVYTQEGAFVEKTREGDVQVIPVKWLTTQITNHVARRQLDPDEAYRIAHVMFQQMEPYQMDAYRSEMDRYGVASRQFKLDRANARATAPNPDSTSAGAAAFVGGSQQPASAASAGVTIPTACPKCGAALMERTAAKGPRAGKKFLGCANYRATGCKFLYNLGD